MQFQSSNKTLLITGACSFIGKHLINYINNNGLFQNVIACCRNINKAEIFKNKNITIVTADLENPKTYIPIFEKYKPDFVIHLAAVARFKQGEENPDKTFKINLLGSAYIISTANNYGVDRFLNVSSNLARNPKGITGYSKYLTEIFIENNNFNTTVLSIRLPNVIDSHGAVTLIFKKQIENNKPVTITDKRMSRKFISPENAAEQLIFSLLNGKKNDVFVNNRPSTPIVDLAKKMIKDSGKEIPIEFIGARSGEKLEEPDYPPESVIPTDHKELFVLKKDKNLAKTILEKLSDKTNASLLNEIKNILVF